MTVQPAGEAGTVTLSINGGLITITDIGANAGWIPEIEERVGREVEASFRNGLRRIDFKAEFEDGQLETRVRERDDTTDVTTSTTPTTFEDRDDDHATTSTTFEDGTTTPRRRRRSRTGTTTVPAGTTTTTAAPAVVTTTTPDPATAATATARRRRPVAVASIPGAEVDRRRNAGGQLETADLSNGGYVLKPAC